MSAAELFAVTMLAGGTGILLADRLARSWFSGRQRQPTSQHDRMAHDDAPPT